jgi:hypothetical protein
MCLTELGFAENAQLRKLSSTPFNTLEVASHVERFWNQQAQGATPTFDRPGRTTSR